MAKALGVQVFTSFPGLEAIERTAKKRAITQKAVKAGAKLVQRSAKSRAPRRKRSGALKQSLGIKAQKGSRGKTLAFAIIGARAKVVKMFKGKRTVPAYYAHLVEKGTKPHSLLSRKRSAGKKLLDFVTRKRRRHPGAKAQPFLRPALDSQRSAVSREMLDTLADEIARVLAKANAKKVT
jgi:HK97 gp10 family phage protein